MLNEPGAELPNKGPLITAITLGVALLGAIGAAGYLGWVGNKAKVEISELEGEVAALQQKLEEQSQDHQQEFATMVATHQADFDRVNKEWTAQMNRQKQQQDQQLQLSLNTISQIVNESGQTLKVMETLESKIRSGKELQEAEVEQLKAVANGLGYLQQQYEKPIHEFRELEAFLSQQLEAQAVEPEMRGKFFRKMFSNEWEEQMQEYYRDQGRIAAIDLARTKVASAYDRAQGEMAKVKKGYDEYIQNLNQIIEEKGANTEALESFFDVSSEILKIHQRVMSIKPDVGTPPANLDRPQ